MWNMHGIEPEIIDYKTMQIDLRRLPSPSRNCGIDLLFASLHAAIRSTGRMGEKIFDDFVKYCRADAGYAALADVVTKEKRDEMESFVLAETFKYFYLLFAPPKTLDFDKVVFNTEAHPFRRTLFT